MLNIPILYHINNKTLLCLTRQLAVLVYWTAAPHCSTTLQHHTAAPYCSTTLQPFVGIGGKTHVGYQPDMATENTQLEKLQTAGGQQEVQGGITRADAPSRGRP